MMRIWRYAAVWLGAVLAAAALTAGELRLVVTADLHGALGNYAALAPRIREAAAGGNAVVIDLGDTVQGVFSSEYAENSTGMAEALNLTGTELWVPGNHDFEMSPEAFREFVRRFRGTALGGDWRCAGISGRPYAVIERGGVRCMVIGLTDPKMPYRLLPGDDMAFRHPYAVLDELQPALRKERPQVVVLAWHNGIYSKNLKLPELLSEYPMIDLVLGAHTHREHPGMRLTRRVYYMQPGSHGHCAGVVDIRTDDKDGRVTEMRFKLVRGDPRSPDPQLAALDRRLFLECAGLYRQPLGRYAPPRPGESGSLLGRRCAEALRDAAKAEAALIWLDAGVPPPPGKGVFTFGDLYRLLPHRNRLCVVGVTRRTALEFIVEQEKLFRRRKWRRELFAAGLKLHRDHRGNAVRIDAPERFTLAVAWYLVAESRVLRPLADAPGFRPVAGVERELVAGYLARGPKVFFDHDRP